MSLRILALTSILVGGLFAASVPASAACKRNEVYSSSVRRCIPMAARCSGNQVYSSSMGQCIPRN
jgi:hypothetical protein